MDSSEMVRSQELQKTVEHAWLFDVDGVITHPEQKRVTEPQIIGEIIKRLERGEPVALVTGRSVDFMRGKVIDLLKAELQDVSVLQNFLAVGEKGGVMLSFDQSGNEIEQIDESITVPQGMQDEAKELVNKKYSQAVFFDTTKRTMISVEMHDGFSLEEFKKVQPHLDEDLKALVAKYNLQDSLTIDSTTIATDIQNRHVGKHFAAEHVLAWLKEKGSRPVQFIAIGDSKSDIAMAQEIHHQGFSVVFIYVGKKEDIVNQNIPFPITFTAGQYEKGTLEYLTSSSKKEPT